MKILFMSLVDFSSFDDRSIYTDLLKAIMNNGHDVYAISPVEKRNLSGKSLFSHDRIAKPIIGTIQKTGYIKKAINMFLMTSIIIQSIKKNFSGVHFDLVICPTPPITIIQAVKYVIKRDKSKFYLLLKDIFPQNAIDLGILKTKGVLSLITKYFRKQEKSIYKNADIVGCMSPRNADYLIAHNPEIVSTKVEVCPNSIIPRPEITDDQRVHFRRLIMERYGIPANAIIYVYGGNLGIPQGIDFLLSCLDAKKHDYSVFFLIVGSGVEYNRICDFLNAHRIDNAKLIKSLPSYEFEKILFGSDVGLIFLDSRFTIPNFPSRLLSYMEASLPILAATDIVTDLREAIQNGAFGLWSKSGDILSFITNITKFSDAIYRKACGVASRKWLENNYDARKTSLMITNHILTRGESHV